MFASQIPDAIRLICFGAALVFTIWYGLTMRLKIVISTSAAAIQIPVSYHSTAFAEEMIDAIEHALIQNAGTENVTATETKPEEMSPVTLRPAFYPHTPA